ncbi:MAG: M28 family peptidase [Balneolaceae bacterium]|nr:M28 family peptidase [Balneolaceae bacterium]
MQKLSLFCCSLILAASLGCQQQKAPLEPISTEIAPNDIQVHISYLASDSLKGRETGTPGEAKAANYIADHFEQFGLRPLGDEDTYFQKFTVNMDQAASPHQKDTSSDSGEMRLARNVAGMIAGKDQPETYLVVGAHYDHLGMGEFGSLANRRSNRIHNGADDNASGTAGILELAHYFSQNAPSKSIIFVAFSGEEIGLLGSQYFVEHAPVPLEQVQAMINLDMIGRMRDQQLMIFGTGSSNLWDNVVSEANIDSLDIKLIPDGTGASDHTSFYNRQIPVLHYFTDTHADYHRPSDDPQYINYQGTDEVLEHLRRLLEALDSLEGDQLAFTEVPADKQQQQMKIEGVTLGVTPDYGYDGPGMRITGVSSGGPAESANLQSGDIIIKLNGKSTSDIYEYMEVLNSLEEGDSSTVTVNRGGQELTLDIQF